VNISKLLKLEKTFRAAACEWALIDGGLVTVAISGTTVLSLITIILQSRVGIDQRRPPITQLLVEFYAHTRRYLSFIKIFFARNCYGVARNVNWGSRLFSSPLSFPLFFSPPFSFPLRPFLSLSSFFTFPLPSLRSRTPKIQLRGMRERCKLPSEIWGGASAEIEFDAF